MATITNVNLTNITSTIEPKYIRSSSPPTEDEIRGSNDWKNILDPFNLKLRKFILGCGNLCEATYDAYINDKMNLPESSFLNQVMLQNASNYQVRSFLYSPASFEFDVDKAKQWIGYVAVTTDEVSKRNDRREIYVVWRGTDNIDEMLADVDIETKPIDGLLVEKGNGEAKVHAGFLDMYTNSNNVPGGKSLKDQLHNAIEELKKDYEGHKEKLSLVITGHSLGGALSILSSFDLVENNVIGANISLVSTVTFSCPQMGNDAFKEMVKKHTNLKILQVRNIFDVIPYLPGPFSSEYVTINTAELSVSTGKSPYLENRDLPSFQPMNNITNIIWNIINGYDYVKELAINQHNLEVLLHVVAWWNGMYMEFGKTPKVERSLALVNKWTNYLKADLHVPASWWADEINKKGMVLEWVPKEWPDWASKQQK